MYVASRGNIAAATTFLRKIATGGARSREQSPGRWPMVSASSNCSFSKKPSRNHMAAKVCFINRAACEIDAELARLPLVEGCYVFARGRKPAAVTSHCLDNFPRRGAQGPGRDDGIAAADHRGCFYSRRARGLRTTRRSVRLPRDERLNARSSHLASSGSQIADLGCHHRVYPEVSIEDVAAAVKDLCFKSRLTQGGFRSPASRLAGPTTPTHQIQT